MNYAALKTYDVANGPGVRVSLFVSGCRHLCKDCFNEIAWDFNYGKVFTKETFDEIVNALKPKYISGFSILGGEPFEPENIPFIHKIAKQLKEIYPDLNIWCYSGFTYENLIQKPLALSALKYIDVLVDGKFISEQKNLMLKFRGSENQRIIDVVKSLANDKVILIDETTL